MTEVLERHATAPAVKSDTPAVSPEAPRAPKLLDQMRERIRVKHYSLSTEKTYLYWVRFFIRWAGMRHPRDMGAAEVEGFLSFLATQREVSAGTQNQAMHAILFLYKEVLGINLPWLDGITRAKAATDAKAMGMDYQALLGHASKAMSDRYIRQREIERVTTLPESIRVA